MFTGIIEETARIKEITKKRSSYFLGIRLENKLENIEKGQSIAVNGACLTVIKHSENELFFEMVPETFSRTSLKRLKKGDIVNIERALRVSSRIEGHFVLGHIDTVGKIVSIGKFPRFYVDLSISGMQGGYVVEKGSIAVDGISLTVGDVSEKGLRVYVIPHTFEKTNIKYKKINDPVNIEYDVLRKYIEKSDGKKPESYITEGFLAEKGFI